MDFDSEKGNKKWEASARKTSMADYANKMMKRSLVTGVANIADTKSKCKRVFKLTVLILCACGFFYQAVLFMQYILTYPSVVDIEVYIPETYVQPAFTFCNNNGIQRTKFCNKYPDRCTVPESIENFCSTFGSFCSALDNKTHFVVVKDEYLDFDENITKEELVELSHHSLIIHDKYSSWKDYNLSAFPLSSPFVVRRADNVLLVCRSMFLSVESTSDPLRFHRPKRGRETIIQMRFNAESDEVYTPERPPGIFFHIHTPFTLENPLQDGVFMQPKQTYVLHLELVEDRLLPHPFSSDCVNYTDLWVKRNRTGPRSQESCIEKCEMEFCFKDCNCTFPEVFYPTTGRVCTTRYKLCHEEGSDINNQLDKERDECTAQCKDDCQRFNYKYTYQMRLQETNPLKTRHDEINDDFLIEVKVVITKQEILKYHQRPQYQNLDVFSSLGGFIGAWLGVSLVAVVDLIESLVNIVCYYFRRRLIVRV